MATRVWLTLLKQYTQMNKDAHRKNLIGFLVEVKHGTLEVQSLLICPRRLIRDRFTTERKHIGPLLGPLHARISTWVLREAEPLAVLRFEDFYAVITKPHHLIRAYQIPLQSKKGDYCASLPIIEIFPKLDWLFFFNNWRLYVPKRCLLRQIRTYLSPLELVWKLKWGLLNPNSIHKISGYFKA